ncbi:MAG: glycosyl transferase family 2 [Pseudonocardiales bacterium]|nr:glycosyl transferase family 2 [Pseudonocardiales bacterium]
MDSAAEPSHAAVLIAVITYRRTADLATALPLVLREAASVSPAADVLVVDNDPNGSARDVVRMLDVPNLRYVGEPVPGIAAARNRAIDEAASARFLVFIDDDEHPEPGWLRGLLETSKSLDAAAVAGPVVSTFETEPDEWIVGGRFFVRRNLPTGAPIAVAATNNLLLDLHQIKPHRLRFDEAFGLTGGSDTLFSRKLVEHGLRMVWCAEAVVVDRVPAARVSRDWVLRRAFRTGNTASRVALALCGSRGRRLSVRVAATLRGLVRLAGGAVRVIAGAAAGSVAMRARGRRTISRGAGMIAGAYGRTFSEYARPQPVVEAAAVSP